jgi:hypothetical protein
MDIDESRAQGEAFSRNLSCGMCRAVNDGAVVNVYISYNGLISCSVIDGRPNDRKGIHKLTVAIGGDLMAYW